MPAQRIFSGFGIAGSQTTSRELVVGRGAFGGVRDRREPVRRQRVAQARVAAAEPLVQGDHAVAGHHAEARLAVRHIARELHLTAPSRARPAASRARGVR